MREASGDLNLTLIVVLTVAGLVAFFSMVIWPGIRGGMTHDQKCSDAICAPCNNCNGKVTCHMKGSNDEFECPYKG